MSAVNFEGFRHPVLAVACPTCHARSGSWCKRPSEHTAAALHAGRGKAADALFIAQHGEAACIERTRGGWRVHATGYSGGKR